ncbi:MAG: sulfatase-like hydrolase/transferase [Vicinamibacterales bacterium]|nr:sulfatase-like hydrolase/transferase [Vicinamibacterales bacterium]
MTPRLRVGLRLPFLVFFLLTACFGVLSYVPFAYLQFLRHQLFAWLEFFVLFHHFLYWAALLLGTLSVADDLAAGRRAAWAIVFACGSIGVWLALHPVLPTLVNSRHSLVVGVAALAIPVAFAMLDHLAARGRVPWERFTHPPNLLRRLLLRMCAATACYVWVVFTVLSAYRIYSAADSRVSATDYALAVGWSLSLHLAVATVLFAALGAISALAPSARLRHWLIAACVGGAGWLVLVRIVFPAIAFRGGESAVLAAVVMAAAIVVWSGLSLRCAADAPATQVDRSWPRLTALTLLPIVALASIHVVEKVDWYFLIQTMIAFAFWIAAFASLAGVRPPRHTRGSDPFIAAALGLSVLIVSVRVLAAGALPLPRVTLAVDRYAAYDPSLMLLERTLTPASTELADLTSFLVANSNIVNAHPASVDFVVPLEPLQGRRPHVFIFVIDSLRRDYLSPYNAAVRFTPAIDAFARESLTFTQAYTRYSGTGLSEPAIWSGALLPHKEYVTPFAPMNALEKLLTAGGYHQLISVDSILRQLLTPLPDIRELDAGIQNRQYETCRTLEEIRGALPDVIRDGRPAFVFTQPQDIHLANVAIDRDDHPEGDLAGFYRPYAARLKRLDACFGLFIQYLKDQGLYENSVVVLTSDHGDSLGDEGRWGHAYTVFPEVIRVPLIMHVPASILGDLQTDTETVAFTTDITPTLYKLLGQHPADRDPLFGMTLVGPEAGALANRRTRPYLVASSYGPVYGLLSDNGRALYIIDSVNTAEHRYDLREGQNGEATIATEAERASAASAIRTQVSEIARFYGVEPVSR